MSKVVKSGFLHQNNYLPVISRFYLFDAEKSYKKGTLRVDLFYLLPLDYVILLGAWILC